MNSRHPDAPQSIHMPDPSFYPFLLTIGVVAMAFGVLWTTILIGIGLIIVVAAIVGWTQENRVSAHAEEGHHD
jgi:hypothetical protein